VRCLKKCFFEFCVSRRQNKQTKKRETLELIWQPQNPYWVRAQERKDFKRTAAKTRKLPTETIEKDKKRGELLIINTRTFVIQFVSLRSHKHPPPSQQRRNATTQLYICTTKEEQLHKKKS
jgi:hypothetical protein